MQREYLQNATHRWNVKVGATGSGKTYLDYAFVIPKRIMNCTGVGLIVLIGNTKNTIERNVLDPMRQIWSDKLVGTIRSNDNTVTLFGKRCYVMGADKVNQVARIQGATIEYCYGDEVTTWNKEVFEMLKSRLRTENSVFDGTCNPATPTHWFKTFIDSDADVYTQSYTIDDNPFLTKYVVDELKKEYAGTVYYDRYILGRWKAAEGIIYRQFADDPGRYKVKLTPEYMRDMTFITIGIDFGGNKSKTKFVATAIHRNFSKLTVIADYAITGGKGDIDADILNSELIGFIQRLKKQFPSLPIKFIWADSAEQYLITGLHKAVRFNFGTGNEVGDSAKRPIRERIIAANTLFNTGRLFIAEDCRILEKGLSEAVWDSKTPDTRLDDFTSDIDILDAFEYSWERFIPKMIRVSKWT